MPTKTHWYSIIVKAPHVPLVDLQGGAWVLMYTCKDEDETEKRFRYAQTYLGKLGEAVVYKYPIDNIGDVRCVGKYNTRRFPRLADVRVADESSRRAFWIKTGLVSGVKARSNPGVRKRQDETKVWGWAIAAAFLVAVMVPAGIVMHNGAAAPAKVTAISMDDPAR